MKPLSEEQIIQNLSQKEDTSAQYYAAWWLGKMRSRHPQAIPLLLSTITALNDQPVDPDRRGVALNATRALGHLNKPEAKRTLIDLLNSKDYNIREEAARSLGLMKQRDAVEPICALLSSGLEGAGHQPEGSPLLQEPCEALLKALGDIGLNEPHVMQSISPFVDHSRPLVRAAACRALLQLTKDNRWGHELITLLKHPEALVRRGALLDLGATGWLDAVQEIQSAAIESSLKLVALRGLAESSQSTDVLTVMDTLL